ncbi:MAG: glycosyltransferase family 1 protein [Bdellovibrionales bacterium]|nr:glycosyltransferase family 1 protein [Bdellovibrionales bacterium]
MGKPNVAINRKVAWKIARSDSAIASVRYRCLIPARHIAGEVESRLYARRDTIDFAESPEAVIFVKSFTSHDRKQLLKSKRLGIPVYLDMCDNIFDRTVEKSEGKADKAALIARNFAAMAKLADGVITTGETLAARIRREVGHEVPIYIIPDSLEDSEDIRYVRARLDDQRRHWMLDHGRSWLISAVLPRIVGSALRSLFFRPKHVLLNIFQHGALLLKRKPAVRKTKAPALLHLEGNKVAGEIRLLWFGHVGIPRLFGMTDLRLVAPTLEKLAATRSIRLVVVSNSYESYLQLIKPLPIPSEYQNWSMDRIGDLIRSCSLTLVPNPCNRFSIAKSPNRTMLSLMHGVPVVASRTPALETFEDAVIFDDWERGISTYIDNPERAAKDVMNGQKLIEARYSGQAVGRDWLALLSGQLKPFSDSIH